MSDILFRTGQSLFAPRIDKSIPRTPLQQKNIENCELLLDRRALLQRLPSGGYARRSGLTRATLPPIYSSGTHLAICT